MNLGMIDTKIQGTVMTRESMGNVTGEEFLDKIFFITDGIMLSQVREIAGLDGSTVQNWVKRGWIGNTVNKRYSKNQLARILIINMIRDTMQLEKIDFLLKYINGKINDETDNIISEAKLYDYICKITDLMLKEDGEVGENLNRLIEKCTSDYNEVVSGSRKRLCKALEIIVVSYYAALLKSHSDKLYEKIRKV
ncbi:MAG: DUF1836 domain-containing protein [Firmicutes bacterium]|nr:DUF1836 domain-containing protein [Bacillota bacterium]